MRNFYGQARKDHLLGPVFHRVVDDWEFHISKVSFYWRRQTEGAPNYDQNFPLRHQPLHLEAKHFHRWLTLFRDACFHVLPATEAQEVFDIAYKVAQNLFGKIRPQDGELPRLE